jgi:hypothetical protein
MEQAMRGTRAVAVLLSLSALALLPASNAHACSCAVFEPAVAREQAVAVFEGVLLRYEEANGGIATFRVDRVWKGDVAQEYAVPAPGPSSMCPPHFEVGQRYIVYVDPEPEGPRVRQCARYAQGRQLAAERAALGPPLQPPRRP